jgi:hypothetical protein
MSSKVLAPSVRDFPDAALLRTQEAPFLHMEARETRAILPTSLTGAQPLGVRRSEFVGDVFTEDFDHVPSGCAPPRLNEDVQDWHPVVLLREEGASGGRCRLTSSLAASSSGGVRIHLVEEPVDDSLRAVVE